MPGQYLVTTRSKGLANIIKEMSALPTKMEKSRNGQNYKLMDDLEIAARLFDLFGELIGMLFHALGRSGDVGKKPPPGQILKNWAIGVVLWWLLPRQTGFSSETIAWLGILKTVGLEILITIMSHGKHQKKKRPSS